MADPAKLDKFLQDPDWRLIEDLIMKQIEPLLDVRTIDINQTNDAIASDVKGRVNTLRAMGAFLNESKLLKDKIQDKKVSFR